MSEDEHEQAKNAGLERAAGLAVAALLVVCAGWLAWRFGPWPEARADSGRASAMNAPAPVQPAAGGAGLLESLGHGTTRTGSGASSLAPREYMDAVERAYAARGFAPGDEARRPESGPVPGRAGGAYYFRSDCPIDMIVAIGRNADPADESARLDAGPAVYLTVASASAAGGSVWSTYRFDENVISGLSRIELVDANGDFPGADPAALPRLPGSRRMLVVPRLTGSGVIAMYETRGSIADVRAWYAAEMTRRFWQLEPYQTGEMAPTGAQIYALGDRICTLWIQPDRNDPERIRIVMVAPT